VLVWQWGRSGSGPKIAALLAEGFRACPEVSASLSLSTRAAILASANPPTCDLPVRTYGGFPGLIVRALSAPFWARDLHRRLRALRPDLAVCAMPGPLDLVMAWVLRRLPLPFVVIVHDADAHPGDGFPLQLSLQRWLCRSADQIAALSTHVGERLIAQGLAERKGRALIRISHPPLPYDAPSRQDSGGPLHLLFFGRLLPYKGLDLLEEALTILGRRDDMAVRVIGAGPESPVLERLRTHACVTVENRWVAEDEVGTVIAWADALVLPYREASQSGIAAVALAAGRAVVATEVGGLREQLGAEGAAILCPPTPSDIAAAIHRILTDPPPIDTTRTDIAGAWRQMAEDLLRQSTPLISGEKSSRA
jgi:glycosyltransferase involved in cell wall biosynthesis